MKQKNPHRDVNAAERVLLALQLRATKMTYDQIAKQCGYADRAACYKAVQRELERTVVERVEELRREELAMLDVLHTEVWERMLDEDYTKSKLFAVDRLIAISERRCKLMGLDVRPEDQVLQQNYIKKIVLTHNQQPGEEAYASSSG